MKKLKKSNFTLLELLVCIFILGISAGFVAIKIGSMLSVIKTNQAIKSIYSHVNLLEKVSIYESEDCVLQLEKKEDYLTCHMNLHMDRKKNQPKVKKYSEITFCFLDEQGQNVETDTLEILFSSTGSVNPKGTLYIYKLGEEKKSGYVLKNSYTDVFDKDPLHPSTAKIFEKKKLAISKASTYLE